jgi:hypothetical protein
MKLRSGWDTLEALVVQDWQETSPESISPIFSAKRRAFNIQSEVPKRKVA